MTGTVLIVEDEPHIVESLTFILKREGFDVLSHGDAEAAMASLSAGKPDVMILDAMLPGANGFEMLRALRGMQGVADIPVLMLTAKGQRRDREIAEEVGADRFMTKPFANADVVAAVKDLIATGRVS